MNTTIQNDFKCALVKFNGFTSEQKGDTNVVAVDECIAKLLDDKKMMSPRNHYSFAERTQMTKIVFFSLLTKLLCDEDYHGVHGKIKELNGLVSGTSITSFEASVI